MIEVQVRDTHSRHLGKYGELISKNATGSYTVQLDCGYRTFQNYQIRALTVDANGDFVSYQLP